MLNMMIVSSSRYPQHAVLTGLWICLLWGCGGMVTKVDSRASITDARCRLGATQTSVLVTEWPAAEKASLESLMNGGGVAVTFSGCSLRVLPQCKLGGQYAWTRTTRATDVVNIDNNADLFLKLPLGAVSLSGELRRTGRLRVKTTVIGERRLKGFSTEQVPRNAACAKATHIVQSLGVGAFALEAGSSRSVSMGAKTRALGPGESTAGGSTSHRLETLKTAGDAQRCPDATDTAPHRDCGSPIQVFLAAIEGQAEKPGPPGTVKTDFVSGGAHTRWDVYINDQAVCTTPCSRWVDPSRPIRLKTRVGSSFSAPFGGSSLQLSTLDATLGPVQIQANPTRTGQFTTGVVFVSLGGISTIAGIALTAVGCSTDSSGMCTGGQISLGVGSLVVAGSIFLMTKAMANLTVRPIFDSGAGPTVSVGPGSIFGTF